MSRITLYTPKRDELDYRAKIMSDPVTMSYNRGLKLDCPCYHNDTGCIDFPESDRDEWYAAWIGREPHRFYAYVRDEEDQFIGEVCARLEDGVYKIGVVIESRFRACGYGDEALAALVDVLFEKFGAEVVENEFDFQRNAAARMHRRAHFTPIFEKHGFVRFVLKRAVYEALK